MATFISHSVADTERLGEEWGRVAENGAIVALSGDLGAGKTQLVRGIASGLGITARIQSPTFALIHIYDGGRLPLFHIDLYRLETREQIIAAGLEEYLSLPESGRTTARNGVTVVEWAERWFGSSMPDRKTGGSLPAASPVRGLRQVQIEALGETERRIIYEDAGA